MIFTLGLVLLGSLTLISCQITVKEFPDPRNPLQAASCHADTPPGQGYKRSNSQIIVSNVCDVANRLTDLEEKELDYKIANVASSTGCVCGDPTQCSVTDYEGFRITIAVVESLPAVLDNQREYETLSPELIRQFARSYAMKLDQKFTEAQPTIGNCGQHLLLFYSYSDYVLYVVAGQKWRDEITKAARAESIGETFDTYLNKALKNVRDFFGPQRDIARGFRYIIRDLSKCVSPKSRGSCKLKEMKGGYVDLKIAGSNANVFGKNFVSVWFCVVSALLLYRCM